MTPNITAEESLAIARVVYPDKEWCRPILPGHPDYGDGDEPPGVWPFHKTPDSADILAASLLAILQHIGEKR